MKPCALLAILLVCPALASAQPTLADEGWASGGGGSATAAVDLGTASAGQLVHCLATWYSSTFTSITDSESNTWTIVDSEMSDTNEAAVKGRVYQSVLGTGGASFTVTQTMSGAGSYPTLYCARFSGATGWTVDKTASTSASAASSGTSGTTSTRATANQLLIGSAFGSYNGGSGAFDWIAGTNVAWAFATENDTGGGSINGFLEYFVASSAGTDAATWSAEQSASPFSLPLVTHITTYSYNTGGGGTLPGEPTGTANCVGPSATSCTTTAIGDVAAGDLLFCTGALYTGNGGSWGSITDSAGDNTWTQVGTEATYGSCKARRYYTNVQSSETALTMTLNVTSGSNSFHTLVCEWFNGADTWVLDQTAQATGSSTTPSSGASSTRTSDNELMIGSLASCGESFVDFTAGRNLEWRVSGYNGNDTANSQPVAHEWVAVQSPGTEAAAWHVVSPSLTWSAQVATFTFANGSDPIPPGDLVPDLSMTTWAPGIQGTIASIPARTTVCATLSAATYGHGTIDASSALQSAVSGCGTEQVVQLSAGTFLVNNKVLMSNDYMTLRGYGAGITVLKKSDGNGTGSSASGQEGILYVGSTEYGDEDNATSEDLTTNGVKGEYTVTITDATGFAAGQIVKLDEDGYDVGYWDVNEVGDEYEYWRTDELSWPIHNPPYPFGDLPLPSGLEWHSRYGRPISEIKEITNVAGNVITFSTPLHWTYRTTHDAQLTRYTAENVQVWGVGIENLSLHGGADGNIMFTSAAYSWMKDIECEQFGNPCISIRHSFRIELRDSYVHRTIHPFAGGAGYCLDVQQGSSEVLIENNAVINCQKNIVFRSGGAGSVVGYNYMDNSYIGNYHGWVEVGINASHMVGSHHVLFEGNQSHNYDSDDTWGGSIHITVFRNWLTGERRDFPATDNVRAAGVTFGNWWHNFVGNVLGTDGEMSGWIYEYPNQGLGTGYGNDKVVWKLGYFGGNVGRGGDQYVIARTLREGNFDYLTYIPEWDTSAQTIPDSLYLSGTPSWWPAGATWPWVDATGGSKLYTLPAKTRYEARMLNPQERVPVGRVRRR